MIFVILYYFTKKLLDRQTSGKTTNSSVLRTILLFSILLIGAISIILSFPMAEETRGQITNLIGFVISGVIAISSATFIGNAIAGIMLRAVDNYKPGDFLQINEHFGRITERGLFHTEIQGMNRDLTTLPNLFLATNPLKVVRSSGTFISSTCSLGYDVPRIDIELALLKAAKEADLEDPFVLITELGDFSVVYKVHGLLKNVKQLLGAQSRLNAAVLDALHDAKIEIVSPNFMNQRQIGDTVFIPKKKRGQTDEQISNLSQAEAKVFDKADEAATIENKKEKILELENSIKQHQQNLRAATTDKEKADIETRIARTQEMKKKLEDRLQNNQNA